ncbi:heavy-metal-associated domain-containing protein [Caloramator australicus]|uniref:Copper chaperone CopZ n=1 Tax=Caloramator australicus RC3 TaxID=857293 RepID=I7LI28_9CLOT|nr:copper ion binding protein [Caloramator australicus]CCJ34488.1 Heavy metal transport/detoxification protein [Caloramator australicus RC3]
MKKVISIKGMTCGHCVMHIEGALKEVCGVKNVVVSLEKKSAEVELAHHVDDSKLKAAIEEAGYEVVSINEF